MSIPKSRGQEWPASSVIVATANVSQSTPEPQIEGILWGCGDVGSPMCAEDEHNDSTWPTYANRILGLDPVKLRC